MERPEERIALIELYERDGHVARTLDVWHWPLTLGRALDNHLVIDDPHLAARHARLALDDAGRLMLQALPSRNGVRLDGAAVAGSVPVPDGGALLQLGTTRLRLRLAGEALAPELPLAQQAGGPWAWPLAAGLLMYAMTLANHWLALDPGADYSAWVSTALSLPVALAAWCGLWALMSKLFQHRFDFTGHLRIALPWMLGITLVDQLWPPLTAAFAAHRLWMLNGTLGVLLLALLVRAHLAHLLPLHRRAVAASVAAMALAGAGLSAALTYRHSDSLVATPYMSTLPLPALRLGGTVPSATLVQDMAPLAGQLAERVKKAREDEDGDADANE